MATRNCSAFEQTAVISRNVEVITRETSEEPTEGAKDAGKDGIAATAMTEAEDGLSSQEALSRLRFQLEECLENVAGRRSCLSWLAEA